MIDVKIFNRKQKNWIRVIKGTLNEIRELMAKEPGLELLSEGSAWVEYKTPEGKYLDLCRVGQDRYKLRLWDDDEILEGPYGAVMYDAVRRGVISDTSSVRWLWCSSEYWDLVGRESECSPYEFRLLELARKVTELTSDLGFVGELKWKPEK